MDHCRTTVSKHLAWDCTLYRKRLRPSQSSRKMVVSCVQVRRKVFLVHPSRVSFESENFLLKNSRPELSRGWFKCGLSASELSIVARRLQKILIPLEKSCG